MDPLSLLNSILGDVNGVFDTNRRIRQANDLQQVRQLLEEQKQNERYNIEQILNALANLPEDKRNEVFRAINERNGQNPSTSNFDSHKYDKLAQIADLHEHMILNDEEYETEKEIILNDYDPDAEKYNKIAQIADLHERKILNDEEYESEKQKLLNYDIPQEDDLSDINDDEIEEKTTEDEYDNGYYDDGL